jgi:hypothetical protein
MLLSGGVNVIERRKQRSALKVVHRHRVGELSFARVSELIFVDGQPRAVLGWINSAGVRMPLYTCNLDPSKLRQREHAPKNTFYYDGETVDPRYVSDKPPADAADR